MSLSLDSTRTAVLFIDFQVDVCARGGRMVAQDDEVLTRFQDARASAARLLSHVRAAGHPAIVHIEHLFDPGYPELQGARLHGMYRYVMSKGAFVRGTDGAAIVSELAPRPGEARLRKTSISPFETTDLAAHLQRRGIDTLIVTGVVTHYAVLATTLAATDRGYRVVVATDACTSADPGRHSTAIAILTPLAEMATVDALIGCL